jgi:hypothetical protein
LIISWRPKPFGPSLAFEQGTPELLMRFHQAAAHLCSYAMFRRAGDIVFQCRNLFNECYRERLAFILDKSRQISKLRNHDFANLPNLLGIITKRGRPWILEFPDCPELQAFSGLIASLHARHLRSFSSCDRHRHSTCPDPVGCVPLLLTLR